MPDIRLYLYDAGSLSKNSTITKHHKFDTLEEPVELINRVREAPERFPHNRYMYGFRSQVVIVEYTGKYSSHIIDVI